MTFYLSQNFRSYGVFIPACAFLFVLEGCSPSASYTKGGAGGVAEPQTLYVPPNVPPNAPPIITKIMTVAGNGTSGFSGDGGQATGAQLSSPASAAVDASGNLYIADTSNNRIRKVVAATGVITTIAGTGGAAYSGDGGQGMAAQIPSPNSVILDGSGNIYVAVSIPSSGYGIIRKLTTSTGVITMISNQNIQWFGFTTGIAMGGDGNLYVSADKQNRVFRTSTSFTNNSSLGTESVTLVAGDYSSGGFSGDGAQGAVALLNNPGGVALDASGNTYIADTGNNRIRKVTASTGIITTIAGIGTAAFGGDGGQATAAQLNQPAGVALDSTGNIYIADTGNNSIRKVAAATGVITTIAGTGSAVGAYSGDGGPATAAQLNNPNTVTVDGSGNIYVTDVGNHSIRKIYH